MLRRNGPVIHAEESLLRERIVKEVARFQTGSEKERELWMVRVVSIDRVGRCGRSMNRQVRDRGTRVRLYATR